MPRKADPTAAAFGLFQVVFASLDTRLTTALVELCRSKEPDFAFTLISALPFGRRLQLFGAALKKLGGDLVISGHAPHEEMELLKEACTTAQRVSKWRNDHIHAAVRLVGGLNAFYDRRGQRFFIDRDECDRMRDEAAAARDAIEVNLPALVCRIDLFQKIGEALADIAESGAQE